MILVMWHLVNDGNDNPCIYPCFSVVSESHKMSMSTFLSGLEASNWLKHIKSVMDTSVFIAKVNHGVD